MKYKNLAVLVLIIGVFSLYGEDVVFDDVMLNISKPYFAIQENLASDLDKGNLELSERMLPLVMKLKESNISEEHKEHYKSIPDNLLNAIVKFKAAKDIAGQREAFREMSKPMAMWATMAEPNGINIAYCSMAPGSWLQQDKDIRNPYFGASMLKCGEIISSGKENTGMKMQKEMHKKHNK